MKTAGSIGSTKTPGRAVWVNGGFMVCNTASSTTSPTTPPVAFERGPIGNLVADGQLHSYKHEGWWQPMDTYQEMTYLNGLWSEGKAPWKVW
jgi:glucose-1-phosphate cytidylyltransferase